MKDKKKIIISIVVIVVILAIIATVLFLNRGPSLSDLFETNLQLSETLESLDLKIITQYELMRDVEDDKQDINVKKEVTTEIQKHYPSNTFFMCATNSDLDSETPIVFINEVYQVNEDDTSKIYYRENLNAQKGHWLYTQDTNDYHVIMKNAGFDFILQYQENFELDKKTVDVDGTTCYKATGFLDAGLEGLYYYNIDAFSSFYKDNDLENQVKVTIYFKADTYELYCLEFDYSDSLQNFYTAKSTEETHANLMVTVFYNAVNSVEEVVVSEEIKNVAVEFLSNEFKLDIDDSNFIVSVNDCDFQFGQPLSMYSDKLTFTYLFAEDKNNMVASKETALICAKDSDENIIMLYVYNNQEETVSFEECLISRIDIEANTHQGFTDIKLGEKINGNSTLEDCIADWGVYTDRFENATSLQCYWKSQIDCAELNIMFDLESEKIVFISVNTMNPEKYFKKLQLTN